MLEVRDLVRRYGRLTAVDGLTFSVGRGEVVGFLGPNGAGKSTTLRVIAGFAAPSSGRITLDGVDVVAHPDAARRRLGYMAEGSPLPPELRVAEYLRYRAELKRVPGRQRAAAVDGALRRAACADVADELIGSLSRGYRQRVGLADALVADPPLLVLDEPTAGLDPNQIREVRALIEGLGQDRTVLLSTHILAEVEAVCQRAVVIHQGRLVADGSLAELRAAPAGAALRVAWVGGDAELEAAVERLPGVRSAGVTRDGERTTATLGAAAAELDGLADAAVAAIAAGRGRLRELAVVEQPLESVFAALTAEPGAAP